MGRMHALAKDFQPSQSEYIREEWFRDELVCNAGTYLPGQPDVLDAFQRLVQGLMTLPQSRDSYGLIHGDFTDVNFFVHDQTITVFDFDDCVQHWFIYDIAVILHDLEWLPHGGMNEQAFLSHFWEFFMQGYARENTLDPFWFQQLPKFLKLRRAYLYGVYHKKWDMESITEKQVGYLRETRHHIMNDDPVMDLSSNLT